MKELVVISGKGGTGKTTVVGAFAALAQGKVIADCDVDAADLHLILKPQVEKTIAYEGSELATVDAGLCTGCGECRKACRFDAVLEEGGKFRVDPLSCEGCGACAHACPVGAIELKPRLSGWIYVSRTPYGTLVHGELRPGEETSGKLVAQVKMRARELARLEGARLLIIDGSPGIGCPVIASLSGAHAALVVTEPSMSALHDLARVVEVARHFRTRVFLAINKADLSPEFSERIESYAKEEGLSMLGRIPYDEGVVWAQVAGRPAVEDGASPAAAALRTLWKRVAEHLSL
ncbi:MAG TPA: 4Fe-4S dicluster domain-containing protein [Candidatus Acetothermia bacterium]|nr:4Fe-4S dicluster domain-containing protein [Candidatus Acetothermia bacterium]